jgi:hypothetical protein
MDLDAAMFCSNARFRNAREGNKKMLNSCSWYLVYRSSFEPEIPPDSILKR